MPLTVVMSNEQKVRIQASPITQGGQPAPVEGPVLFVVKAGDVAIEPIDATSAYVVAGLPGASEVLVSADADLGAGVVTIADTIGVTVSAAMAEQLGLQADAPILKA